MASEPVNQLATGQASRRRWFGLVAINVAMLALVTVQPVAAATDADAQAKPARTGEKAKPKTKAKAKPKADNVKHQWFVQAGAFANEANAKNVQARVETTGLQATAEASDTKAGRLIRVRSGPFENKAEAEKAALRIKALDLPAVLVRQ